ncbi:hypothetical protein E2562_018149 [Oryza meyeriana var. granulata]|uniref:Uncharacterized protein n=1 Tax=Oryza meyeriana var. granulata TaxID=110450 RepID=A0A6G1C7Q0_9ORYZ|nr:hypothetical protein E2562_018149 [Oryza meyeriana var. granulata]
MSAQPFTRVISCTPPHALRRRSPSPLSHWPQHCDGGGREGPMRVVKEVGESTSYPTPNKTSYMIGP